MTFIPPEGPKQRKQVRRASGVNPLSYMGVMPESPTNYVTFDKDPTTKDFKNWEVGDEWENRTTKDVFKLVAKGVGSGSAEGYGTWVKFASLTAISTITAGDNIVITNPSPTDFEVNLEQGTNKGEILIANATTGVAEWNTLTEGAHISITNDDGHITIAAEGGEGGDVTFDCDTLTATTDSGSIDLVGTAGRITTTGDLAHTVTLDIGDDVALKADIAEDFVTDSGTASPSSEILNVLGGQNTNTSGSGNSLIVNVNDTYQVDVAAATLEIGTVDATQTLGSISIEELKVLLGLP